MKKVVPVLMSLALGFGMLSCGDDKASISTVEKELQSCDFRKASEQLEELYASTDDPSDIALARSFLGLLNIVHNPNIQRLLPKFGLYDNPDISPVWNSEDGLFAQMVAAPSKKKSWENILNKLPLKYLAEQKCEMVTYEWFGEKYQEEECEGPDWTDTCDPSLTFEDMIVAIKNMRSDFESFAKSFEQAADSVASGKGSKKISKAGCGLGEITFDAADLYFLAAIMHATNAAADIGDAYEFGFSFIRFLGLQSWGEFTGNDAANKAKNACDEWEDWAEVANKKFLKLKSNNMGKADHALNDLFEVARLLNMAIKEANNASSDSFFGWKRMPEGVKDDIKTVTSIFLNSKPDGKVDLGDLVTPKLELKVGDFFKDLISSDNYEDVFEFYNDNYYYRDNILYSNNACYTREEEDCYYSSNDAERTCTSKVVYDADMYINDYNILQNYRIAQFFLGEDEDGDWRTDYSLDFSSRWDGEWWYDFFNFQEYFSPDDRYDEDDDY